MPARVVDAVKKCFLSLAALREVNGSRPYSLSFGGLSHGIAALAFTFLFLAAPVGAVSDSEMCFFQPIDQCSGDVAFQTLGSVDGDTTGKDYLFEIDVSGAGQDGTLYLQHKDGSTTQFTNVSNSVYNSLYGSNENIFFGNAGDEQVTIGEGNSTTVTIDGTEVTFEVVEVYPGSAEAEFLYNGVNQGTQSAGYDFSDGVSGGVNVLTDVYANDRTVTANQGDSVNFESDSGTQTFNVVTINENNIEYNINGGSNSFADDGESIFYDGQEIVVDGIVFVATDDPANSVDLTFVGNGIEYAEFTNYGQITAPEGYNEYRSMWVGSDGSTAWSDSIYPAVDRDTQPPIVDRTGWGSPPQLVNQPRTLTDVPVNADVYGDFVNLGGGNVNISLVDADTGQRVSYVERSSDGLIETFSQVIAYVFSGGGTSEFYFPTAGTSFLNQSNTVYNYYFEIEDLDTGNTRDSKVYSMQTSGEGNDPPNITSVEYRTEGTWQTGLDNVSFGENVTGIRVDVQDANNGFHDGTLEFYNVYDDDVRVNRSYDISLSGNEYQWNLSNGSIDDSGEWRAEFAISDYTDTDTETLNWSYPFGEPTISLSTSNLVQQYTLFNTPPTLELGCPSYECINENESVNVYLDPKPLTGNKVPEVEVE